METSNELEALRRGFAALLTTVQKQDRELRAVRETLERRPLLKTIPAAPSEALVCFRAKMKGTK